MINEIEQFIQKTAIAFNYLKDYKYLYLNEFGAVEKKYPCLLFDKRITGDMDANNNNIAYSCILYILDEFTIEQRGEIPFAEKQTQLIASANQLLKELIEKNETKNFYIIEDNVQVELFDRVTIDSVIGIQINLKFNSFIDCDSGIFDYGKDN